MNTIDFPVVDEDDYAALMDQRSQVIGRLAALEEALREKHGATCCTI